jgi:hypothetical protein
MIPGRERQQLTDRERESTVATLDDAVLWSNIRANADRQLPAALDNFSRVFAIRPDDRVLLLMDRGIDPQVPAYIAAFARGRGAAVQSLTVEHSGNPSGANAVSVDIPAEVEPILGWATFVVSTWFSSIVHPLPRRLRSVAGQRWVKITQFRDLDCLRSDAAAYPLDVISELLRQTAACYPVGNAALIQISDSRGTQVEIRMAPEHVSALLGQSRWRGEVTAEAPGCYVHYLPTHGPNLVDEAACGGSIEHVDGVVHPQYCVGLEGRLDPSTSIEFRDNVVVGVDGGREDCRVLETMLANSRLVELGCGFNPGWPRRQIYPAGSNAPGALHFGMDLDHEDDFIKRTLPDWPEPPVHMDVAIHDADVSINDKPIVANGRLLALDNAAVRTLASRYGDPVRLLDS